MPSNDTVVLTGSVLDQPRRASETSCHCGGSFKYYQKL